MFKSASFTGASGKKLGWKVECDSLTDEDWGTLATLVAGKIKFGKVEGVPTGGLKFAKALEPHIDPKSAMLLIVDDVLTTGGSMESQRNGRTAVGVVTFARATPLDWIIPIFSLSSWLAD